ncbi:hypothetical protein [Actinoplanes sp. NPDC049118]|uniref:hypothetical protein n=1 Tax=Actinoplanes sp. NPDC049118 TaxID=3155769 RepID=UPI0033F04EF7
MPSVTVSAPAWTATLISPHTNPRLHVSIGSTTLRLRLDLGRLQARQRRSSSLVGAAITEAVLLLRRHTGCAPTGRWARETEDRNAFTVAIEEMPGRCETCVHGCGCRVGHDGCGHLGCPGVRARELADSCPGIAVLMARPRARDLRTRR